VAGPALAQQEPSSTADVFDRYSGRVVKIEVREAGSAAKAVTGSGFLVSDRGHLITNYHVISKLIHDPERYVAVAITEAGQTVPVRVLALDVVHDLAVIQGEVLVGSHFTLTEIAVAQGRRLYSMGHPYELGLTIAEGTFNGMLEHTRYERIHFTGPINPGMSGGPTITAGGEVVGINVATAGNEVSFLVPVRRALRLMEEVQAPGYRTPDDLLPLVQHQIDQHQEAYLGPLLAGDYDTVTMGPYRVPSKLAPYFNCWGDTTTDDDAPYSLVDHQCGTDDYIFISSDMESGVVRLWHRLLEGDQLNRFRFYSLYSDDFQMADRWFAGNEDEVTRFTCEDRTVRTSHLTLKAVFCVRGYRKLQGLYDAVIKAAVLGGTDVGLETSLVLSGVSFENALDIMARYLEALEWIR
jgi:hypothetical protein